MDARPYHEQLNHEEFAALLDPNRIERMPQRLFLWGLVEHGLIYDGGYVRPGFAITEDGIEVRARAQGRFGFPPGVTP